MDKLKSSYSKYQTEVFALNPRFVSSEKAGKLSILADNQIQKMRTKQDFSHYQEGVFYKQKFNKLSEVATQLQTNRISEENYHKSVRQIMQDDFSRSLQRQTLNPATNKNRQTRSKSPLNDFFQEEEVKKSKVITFSQLLSQDQTPLKYKLRSVSRSKSPVNFPNNNEQLRLLEEQNRRLRQKLNSEKYLNPNQQERLRQLRDRLRDLNEENRRLKTEVSRSQQSEFILQQEYDPYNLKVRENNIVKIHNKNFYMSQRMSQLGAGLSEDLNMERNSPNVYYENKSDHIRSQMIPIKSSPIKRGNYNVESQDVMNSSQSTIQTQFLNLEDSELYDEQKYQLCRQKIAFFKKSMVLGKTPDFEIAFKRSEFNFQMDKLRLILYVNNKSSRQYNNKVEYDYDREDFDIIVKRKLQFIEARSQGRQQIEITLKNSSDLGSLIYAKLLVGDKMMKVIVPALFIDFDNDYRYQFENVGYIQRNLAQPLVIKPMSQFLSIDTASNVLELTREYEQKYDVGKIYGKSKACKGIVKLTWKKGKLKIQTCEQWRTLIGFLFLNAQETLNY